MLSPSFNAEIKGLFYENQLCVQQLISNEFVAMLDHALEELFPFDQRELGDLSYVSDIKKLADTKPMKALQIVETESPLLFNRDLASVALMRMGDFNPSRADKLVGLFTAAEDKPLLALESALSLCHWRNWKQPLSRWWDWKEFLDILEHGFHLPEYAGWCSYAYIWAYYRQGGDIDREDSSYQDLIVHLNKYFKQAKSSQDRDLQIACDLALNQLQDRFSRHTVHDRLEILS